MQWLLPVACTGFVLTAVRHSTVSFCVVTVIGVLSAVLLFRGHETAVHSREYTGRPAWARVEHHPRPVVIAAGWHTFLTGLYHVRIPDDPLVFELGGEPWSLLARTHPRPFEVDGCVWPTLEHYLQAQHFRGDAAAVDRERIRKAATMRIAQDLGSGRHRRIREDWSEVRDGIMRHALRCKFADPEARRILESTGSRDLFDASKDSEYWSMGRLGAGQNRLGELLVELRAELRAEGR